MAVVMGSGGVVLDAVDWTGGFRRWGMDKGWFMGVPGWVWDWPVGGWCVWWGGVGDRLFGVVRGRPPTTVSPMSPKVVAVGPLDGFRVWVRFDDGTSGDIDLAHLAELPMYEAWHDPNVFATVRVGEYGHDITWYTPPVDVDFVAHWLYTEITGVTFSELMNVRDGSRIGK